MVIVGGSSVLLGPLCGAVIVLALTLVASSYTEHWVGLLGLLFLIVVLFMPDGVLPSVTRMLYALYGRLFRPKGASTSVLRNVAIAALGKSQRRWNPFVALRDDDEFHSKALNYLCLVGLDRCADAPLATCSYGEKRRLELAMALAQEPKLLLLDEPLAGLSRMERHQVCALLGEIPRSVSIVMIEHDMDAALTFAERVSVLQHGRLIVDGTREEVVADPKTREVYLGR
jgi:ABC-type branched-subunit amino acid transport system ATPase component